ncbi:interleukin-2 receptor subunit beta [Ornithorhynchus anatinus]|uniref:interleukin-2 receptor subunit beta n=1 Tax=Ornithorhynchus anatinus TaxID=9258 RepID=UPI0010A7F214|nr:interleukin-2 receptor subunit beta [Ornithorhynchus anatinus]XP_028935368.1 interleukin-2 receptor subunit beta [Ornithorhynchus anatinus]XP_028935371.1 interleukin-2 receptor subunit beta [Ornithorhynchus anatinus]
MKTSALLRWSLPIVFLLLLLFLMGAWGSGAANASSSLTCFYDSRANLSCTWVPAELPELRSCSLEARTNYRDQTTVCNLLPMGSKSFSCNLILDPDVHAQALTVVEDVSLKVTCENWKGNVIEKLKPFGKIRLIPPDNLHLSYVDTHSCNFTWQLRVCSHYLRRYLEFEVRYWALSDEGPAPKTLFLKQPQEWIKIEGLSPDTRYKAQVRGKPGTMYLGHWSLWSQAIEFQTKPEDPAPSQPWLFNFILGLCGALGLVTIAMLIPRWCTPKWLKKVLKCHIPDPSEFFTPLSSQHGGDFQKWISSPFSTASFMLGPAEISPLEVMQKEDKDPRLLLPKELVQSYAPPDTSGLSGSSCFTNQGYFFFHLPDALEIESCQVYFTYEPFAEAGGPASANDDDSYCMFPSGEDALLFPPGPPWGPGQHLGLQNSSFEAEEAGEAQEPAQQPVEAKTPFPPAQPGPGPFLPDDPSPQVLRLEPTGEGPSPASSHGVGTSPPFPWAGPPASLVPIGGDAPFCPASNAGAYLSLRELQNQYPAHLV